MSIFGTQYVEVTSMTTYRYFFQKLLELDLLFLFPLFFFEVIIPIRSLLDFEFLESTADRNLGDFFAVVFFELVSKLLLRFYLVFSNGLFNGFFELLLVHDNYLPQS